MVTRGYKRLQGVTGVTGGLDGVTRGKVAYKRLQEITRGYKSLQKVTRGYKRLHGVTVGYKKLQGVTRGYKG